MRRCVAVLAVCAPFAARADVPGTLGYQGRLLAADGTPVVGMVTVGFSVWDQAVGGNQLWAESQNLGLTDGFYATVLGGARPFTPDVFDGSVRYLELNVGGGGALSPRQQIASVAYALAATSVVGGAVNASSLAVGGSTVVDGSGHLTGPAAYSAGAGLTLASNAFSIGNDAVANSMLANPQLTLTTASPLTGGGALPLGGTLALGLGTVPIANGGTGLAAGPSANQFLRDDGAGHWKTGAITAADLPAGFSGTLSGDVTGSFGATQLSALAGAPLSASGLVSGDVLRFTSANGWAPDADVSRVVAGAGISVSSASGAVAVGNAGVLTVGASGPLSSSGGANPSISLTGVVPIGNLPVGASAASIAAGNDPRIAGALQSGAAAGGDLGGAYPAPTIASLQGTPLAASGAVAGDALTFDGTQWIPRPANAGSVTRIATGAGLVGGPITSSGTISLGVVPIANGGTGLSSAPTVGGQFLRSSGNGAWAISALGASDLPAGSASYVQTAPGAAQVVQPSADVTPLAVRPASGGSADVFQAQDASGNALARVSAVGVVSAAGFAGSGAALSAIPLSGLAPGGAANGQVVKWNGSAWAPGPDNGGITSLTFAPPLTGGTITASGTIGLGTVPATNGGTGLASPGTSGGFLKSTGSAWTSAALTASDVPDLGASYVKNQSASAQSASFSVTGSGTLGGLLTLTNSADTTTAVFGGYGGNSGTSKQVVIAGNVDNGLPSGDTRALLSLQHTNPLGGNPAGRILEVKGSTGALGSAIDVAWIRGNGAAFFLGSVGVGTATPSTALQVAGTATATAFAGNGAALTGLSASSLSSGTVPLAQLSGITSAQLASNAAIANGQLASSQVTISPGTGLTGGGAVSLGGSTSLSLANTAVAGGSYTRASIVVDAQGRLTSAANGAASNLASGDVTGVLPVGSGGTGASTLTTNGVLLGGATVASTPAGASGQLLVGQSGAPTWTTLAGDATLSGAGALTVAGAAGNFSVGGNVKVGDTNVAAATDRTVYVSTAGSDTNAGTPGAPFATLARALSEAPTILDHNFTIQLAAGTYAFGATTARGFTGRGALYIFGVTTDPVSAPTVVISNSPILLSSIQVPIYVQSIKATTSTGQAPLLAQSCSEVHVVNTNAQTTAGAGNWAHTIEFDNVERGYVAGSIVGTNSQYGAALYARAASFVSVDSTTVSGAGAGSEVGVEASDNGFLYLSSSTVAGFAAAIAAGLDHYGDAVGGGVVVNSCSVSATSTCLWSQNGGTVVNFGGNTFSCPTQAYATPVGPPIPLASDVSGVLPVSNGGTGASTPSSSTAYVALQASAPGTQQTGSANVSGTVTAAALVGNGAGLTALSASNVASGTLALSFGGTGANSAASARTSLGAAASGANADITSLTALAADLSVGGHKVTNIAAPVASTDAANKSYVDAATSGGVQYLGITPSTFTGNLGGIGGANAKCQAAFSGSHFCHLEEMARSTATSFQNGWARSDAYYEGTSYVYCRGGGISGPPSGGSSDSPCSCIGWTNGSNTNSGVTFTSTNADPAYTACGSSVGIHCCK